jgi:glycosyltransferase involved in cell wall biosynthesis
VNIMLVTGIFPPDIGGPAKFISKLATWLISRGHRVTVLSLTDREVDVDISPELSPRLVLLSRKSHSKFSRFRAIRKFLKSAHGKFDVVLLNGLYLEFFIGTLFLEFAPKIYYKVVGDYLWEYFRLHRFTSISFDVFNRQHSLLKKVLRSIFLIPFHSSGKFLVPSQNLRRTLVLWGIADQRITVIENCFLGDRFELLEEQEDIEEKYLFNSSATVNLITVARLVNWKGVDQLINLLQHRKDYNLSIVGDGPELGRLVEIVKELRLSERVKFWGRLSEESTLKIIGNSSIFVLNSEYEGMSHTILEAMACGTPVIAALTSGNVELLNNECGILFQHGNQSQLEIVIDMITTDDQLRQKLVVDALSRIWKRNSKENIFRAYEKILLD